MADATMCICYSTAMKTLLKILLLALFALVVFMPMGRLSQQLYWSLFILMFVVLYLYYRFSYWVGEKDLPIGEYRFSIFAGKIPPMTTEDLVRGRLVVTADRLVLYQKTGRRETGARAKEIWSARIDQVSSFSVGKVVGLRGGLTVKFDDGQEAAFAIFFMKRHKQRFAKALGWAEDASMN